MALQSTPVRAEMPTRGCVLVPVRILGTGAANPTKEVGNGVTVTRVSEGLYRFTFSENQGTFVGAWAQFAKNAPAAAAGQVAQVDWNSWTATGRALDILIEDPGTEAAAPAVADLGADERLLVLFMFER